MATSRTGTAPHLAFRLAVLTRGQETGTTRCPCTDPHKHHTGPCNVWLDYENSRQPNSAEPDHIIPITRGGTDHPDNGRVICRRCNQARGNRTNKTTSRPAISTGYRW